MNVNVMFYHIALSFSHSKKTISVGLFFISFVFSLFGQISVTTNVPNANYSRGDNAQFIITSTTSGTVTWNLKYDNYVPLISSGTFHLNAGETKFTDHSENSAGVVIFTAVQGGSNAVASAVFSYEEIAPFQTKPSDLTSFWNSKKQELATVPINPVVTQHSSTTYSTSYRVELDNIDGRKVYGYLSVPNTTGPFPAVITLPPYGEIPNITVVENAMAEQAGVLSFSVSIHNVLPDQQDPNAYEPDDISDKNANYYKYALLGAVRAIDYIFTRSDFDGMNVGVTGISQGAGLSLLMTGVDDRINLLMYNVPTLCQNSGLAFDRAGGFPNYVSKSRGEVGTAAHEAATIEAANYYDGMFLIQNCNYPVMMAVSYLDDVTPAATGLAAYNQLPTTAPRVAIHSTNLGHASPMEYFQGRYDFIHRYFPSSVNTTTWPYNNNKGYHIDAGANANAIVGDPFSMSGTIEKNAVVNDASYELEWSVVEGPGIVTFSSTTSYSPTATFSEAGTYLLRFQGVDNSLLSSNDRFIKLQDHITVEVESLSPLPVELIAFDAAIEGEDIRLNWLTASETNNKGFEILRADDTNEDLVVIDFVAGANDERGSSYSFLDKNVEKGKTYYYQLRQLDFDDTESFSSIVSEMIYGEKSITRIYPTHTINEITIEIIGEGIQKGSINIVTLQGQIIKTIPIELDGNYKDILNLNDLPSGSYFMEIKIGQTDQEVLIFFKS